MAGTSGATILINCFDYVSNNNASSSHRFVQWDSEGVRISAGGRY